MSACPDCWERDLDRRERAVNLQAIGMVMEYGAAAVLKCSPMVAEEVEKVVRAVLEDIERARCESGQQGS